MLSQGALWDYDFFFSKKGMRDEDIVVLYNQRFNTVLDPAHTVEIKHRYFQDHGSDFKPIDVVVDVVRRYNGILPMAVASGGTRRNVTLQLESIGVRNLFAVVLSGDDNITPKPAPDIFLAAAKSIAVPPHLCQVFEDGDLGLEAARKAGMFVTDVRDYE